jgi:hypothetical protein
MLTRVTCVRRFELQRAARAPPADHAATHHCCWAVRLPRPVGAGAASGGLIKLNQDTIVSKKGEFRSEHQLHG